ncbi:MAG TPA: PilZ domain-containing protein [Myxococcota bacterium]|nr:PilZ domain-containing protein [Myxococcota bacterium]
MPAPSRLFQREFASADEFQREHAANLINGGVFIATEERVEPRELVSVQLTLAGSPERVRLDGEVVHIIPPEMAQAGALPGVAVQFALSQTALRAALEPLVRTAGAPRPQPAETGRRKAPRMPAQVPIRIRTPKASLAGHTRDISLCGVLVSVPGDTVPVGTTVQLAIDHPTSGESLSVDARVTRQVASQGGVVALAIEFEPPPEQQEEVRRFIADLQSAEHSRRLGGMHGSLAEIGPPNLLQMLGKTAPSGTLTLTRDNEEARIGFENQLLRYAQLGAISGVKALARAMAWADGAFEFHARLEPSEVEEPPISLDAALLDATRLNDELARMDRSALPDDAKLRFRSTPAGPAGAQTSKLEDAVLDLARGEFTIRRVVDMIPEPDVEILRAIAFLADLGSIAIVRS